MNMTDSAWLRRPQTTQCLKCATEIGSGHADEVPDALCADLGPVQPPRFEFEGYRISVANTRAQISEVLSLVHRMYAWRGYRASLDEGFTATSDRITLHASNGEHVMGTLSVALDSAEGLAADELYPDEVESFRKPGKRLCEFMRLAVDVEPRINSKDFLARLIHVAFVYAHLIQRATDMLIEVNPRHVGFYRRSLGFSQKGPERICRRVNAPAVLMHIDLHHMAAQIRMHGGGAIHGGVRTLYPHFLSGDEQRLLLERMRFYVHHLKPAEPPSTHRESEASIQRTQVAEAQHPLAA